VPLALPFYSNSLPVRPPKASPSTLFVFWWRGQECVYPVCERYSDATVLAKHLLACKPLFVCLFVCLFVAFAAASLWSPPAQRLFRVLAPPTSPPSQMLSTYAPLRRTCCPTTTNHQQAHTHIYAHTLHTPKQHKARHHAKQGQQQEEGPDPRHGAHGLLGERQDGRCVCAYGALAVYIPVPLIFTAISTINRPC